MTVAFFLCLYYNDLTDANAQQLTENIMKYKYLIVLIFGRANFGQIFTDVEVREEKEDDDQFFGIYANSDMPEVTNVDPVDPNVVLGEEETEFMVGNNLEEMIQIYNKNSVDLYEEDLMGYFDKMKQNIGQRIDLDL